MYKYNTIFKVAKVSHQKLIKKIKTYSLRVNYKYCNYQFINISGPVSLRKFILQLFNLLLLLISDELILICTVCSENLVFLNRCRLIFYSTESDKCKNSSQYIFLEVQIKVVNALVKESYPC